MRTKRNARGRCGRVFQLLAALILAAGCAGTPAPVEPAMVETGAGPEIIEISSAIPQPVRFAVSLPDPAAKSSRPALPTSASPAEAAPAPLPAAKTLQEAAPLPAAPHTAAPAPAAKPTPAAKSTAPETASQSKSPAAPAVKPQASPAPAKPSTAAAASKPGATADQAAAPAESPAIALPPAPASTAQTVPKEAAVPTRSEETPQGGRLELPFKGSGWVFLGETSGREGLKYDSRRFDGSAAIFLFTAERPGDYVLRFQRQDPLSGDPESLLVKVRVQDPATAAKDGSAVAAAAETLPTSEASGAGPAATSASAPATTDAPASRVLPSSPEELLRLAREELAASRIASVLEVLDRYISLFPFGSDEAFYLYGKAYEENTPYRDIKKAYANYKQIRDEWPRSRFWKQAAERVTYIERHYFDIR